MNETVRKLTQLLESNDLELRIAAIRVITEIGLRSRQLTQGLGRCLREPHDELRLQALRALARLGAAAVAPMVVPLILASGPLRDQAMAVVSAVGPTVIPQLKLLYPTADFHGKRAVITALSRIGGKAAPAFLLKILPQEPFELQKHLALSLCEALDKMTPVAQAPILSMVLRLLRQKEIAKHPQILVTGAILLGHFRGPALAARARAELRALADKKHPPEVGRHAIVSFNRLLSEGKVSNADEQFLWKALSDDDWHNVAQHALTGFQRLEVPKKALPKVIDLLHRSPHFSVHIHVFERLQSSDHPKVAEEVLPFLADSRYRVREAAEAALRKMPTSIESLFSLLMKTEDLEVTQRINAILRDFPQATRQKYVERASARLLSLFEESDPHYKSFLEFVKNLDPEPLRKRIYQKAQALKKGKARDKWQRMGSLLQILWDNHLITAEGRYLLAVAVIRSSSPKDLTPAARRANLGLRVLKALIYDDYAGVAKRLTHDKDLTSEDYYYLGFHFSEEGEEMRPFSSAMLEHVIKHYPKAAVAGPAAHKLQLQAQSLQALQVAAAAKAEADRKKELRKQRKAQREAERQGHPGSAGARPAASTHGAAKPSTPRVAAEPVAPAPAKPLAGAGRARAGGPAGLPRAAASPEGTRRAARPAQVVVQSMKRAPVAAAKTAVKKDGAKRPVAEKKPGKKPAVKASRHVSKKR
jgi:HEAT repeat protein